MKTKNILIAITAFLLTIPVFAQKQKGFNATTANADPQMASHFKTPPHIARPRVFWMWLRVNTSKEAITKDRKKCTPKVLKALSYTKAVPAAS
ncbi:hypothetical protein HK413_08715 [Mucilaginibacter sp. S1162]|uniref:Uncharacterized protein n=1 Tax=Mucilaginibacter humi TaxID=2732510 RepID=A0ABX1W3G7_9SPHI|nr:hypothetical protein [Mucilaginibacter humi]NNU34206.1 hypothetical protein [Mucilaginibacter humi]